MRDSCNKKKICICCEATFVEENKCNLIKKCPACRFLGVDTPENGEYAYYIKSIDREGQFVHSCSTLYSPYIKRTSTNKRGAEFLLRNEDAIKEYVGEFVLGRDFEEREELLNSILNEEDSEILFDAFESAKLTKEEIKALCLLYGINTDEYSLGETAKRMKKSTIQVRSLISKAMKKLTHPKTRYRLRRNTYL